MSGVSIEQRAEVDAAAVTILAAARRRLTDTGHTHAALDRTITHGLVLDVDEQGEVATLTIEYDHDACVVRGHTWDAARRAYREAVYVEAATAAEIDRAVYQWLRLAAPEAALLTVEVTTPEEADSLPVGTVLRDGREWVLEADVFGLSIHWLNPYSADPETSEEIALPARVLYVPDGAEGQR